jgi:hypothetical protein
MQPPRIRVWAQATSEGNIGPLQVRAALLLKVECEHILAALDEAEIKRISGSAEFTFSFNIGVSDINYRVSLPLPAEHLDVPIPSSRRLPPPAPPSLALSAIIIPERRVAEGVLVRSVSLGWAAIIDLLRDDWSLAYQIPPQKWEEIIAGAYQKAGFDEVILTPRSGDHGRDVIAIKHGIGCIKIIDSVKAYRPGHLVSYDDVRAMIGVMTGERDVSKAVITTTSDFPPRVMDDPFIAPFVPTRLQLINGEALRDWLSLLLNGSESK